MVQNAFQSETAASWCRYVLRSPAVGAPSPGWVFPSFKNLGLISLYRFIQTIEFAEQRIPVLNEYCVVCDEPHVFQNGPMLRVSTY